MLWQSQESRDSVDWFAVYKLTFYDLICSSLLWVGADASSKRDAKTLLEDTLQNPVPVGRRLCAAVSRQWLYSERRQERENAGQLLGGYSTWIRIDTSLQRNTSLRRLKGVGHLLFVGFIFWISCAVIMYVFLKYALCARLADHKRKSSNAESKPQRL